MKEIADYLSERSRMQFVHSVTGCDTVSAIYGKGTQTLFKKLGNRQLKSVKDALESTSIQ